MSDSITVPAGMVAWHGGDSAPANWDGGRVQFRHGGCSILRPGDGLDWRHGAIPHDIVPDGRTEIVAYTPRIIGDSATGEREARDRIVRWIDQALERADKHGSTEGLWLLAKQWRLVRAALTPPATNPIGQSGEVEAALKRVRERLQIRWTCKDKDGGSHQMVDDDNLRVLLAVAAQQVSFTPDDGKHA